MPTKKTYYEKLKDPVFNDGRFICDGLGPPESEGVYAICVVKTDDIGLPDRRFEKQVVYIGSSQNIKKRVMTGSHIYRRLFNRLENYWVITFFYECDQYLELESELIRKYKPRFNIKGTK